MHLRHSFYRTLIGNHTQSIEWYHVRWPWVTSDSNFKVATFLKTKLLLHKRKLNGTIIGDLESLFVSWCWQTCIARVCQHQLSFLFWVHYHPVLFSLLCNIIKLSSYVKVSVGWCKQICVIRWDGQTTGFNPNPPIHSMSRSTIDVFRCAWQWLIVPYVHSSLCRFSHQRIISVN